MSLLWIHCSSEGDIQKPRLTLAEGFANDDDLRREGK